MGKIYHSILELIGKTPIVELHKIEEQESLEGHIYAKLEFFNPGGSVKDRIALRMIEAAEKDGTLNAGGTIIEGTSGNTGIGLAAVAAAKGYKAVLCMPDNMSRERISMLKGYGAKVVLTKGEENMKGANEKAAEILADTENAIIVGQGGNPNNPKTHFDTTGPEIWEDMDGKVDIFIAAAGTGGTITGVGEYLRSKKPDVEIIAVEPAGCPVLSGGEPGPHKIQGIGGGMIPPVLNREIYNEVITVTDEAAFATAVLSAAKEGISIGISAGAALFAAIQVAGRSENAGKNIVVIFADSGERYISSNLYE
ncbi:cysteine synthase [Kineothrix alysoides]|uniref:Cysteine synthase n=1 Tax=Kineothrix alysoides TaxID=1469948 RepID=A0A4V2QC64_9FIRM|nr:cysteine synthase A [Kineothrix alysoides]TCL59077.1 cysteine synthase [Kineothrix alysoides]